MNVGASSWSGLVAGPRRHRCLRRRARPSLSARPRQRPGGKRLLPVASPQVQVRRRGPGGAYPGGSHGQGNDCLHDVGGLFTLRSPGRVPALTSRSQDSVLLRPACGLLRQSSIGIDASRSLPATFIPVSDLPAGFGVPDGWGNLHDSRPGIIFAPYELISRVPKRGW